MSEFSESDGNNSEHARRMQFKTLQLNYKYFAKAVLKRERLFTTTQLIPSHILILKEEQCLFSKNCFTNTIIKKTME